MNRIQSLIQRAIRIYSIAANQPRQMQMARRLNFLMTMAVKMRYAQEAHD